jgi:alanine racemase
LADAPSGWLARTLELGGIPNVSSRESIEEAVGTAAARGTLTVRVGVLDATGWSAIPPEDASHVASALAGTGMQVELWTHITAVERRAEILGGFWAARQVFEEAGVPVVSSDVASTAWARRDTAFDRLRIGVGLFGARLGAPAHTLCALRVVAPIVRRVPPGGAGWAGYGTTRITANRPVAVLRCGYGDGFPKTFAGTADILSVGMQYTTRFITDGADARVLIGEADDVDELAARAGMLPHELVVGLACK